MVDVILATLDYVVLLLCVIALFAIGFCLSNKKSASNTDIFLVERLLRWWQIGFSMFSANASQ